MLLRQLFNHPTFGYTYLLADPSMRECVLIDPVKGKVKDYVQLLNELGLFLVAAIDTHSHDDHTSALPMLRKLWDCESIAGGDRIDVSRRIEDGDRIRIGRMVLEALHTPGHTRDSFCFLIERPDKSALFTGDTLLVRNIGLSDQPTSNPRDHYLSLSRLLVEMDDETIIYPGRDFKGWPLSTIREEKTYNPYLLVGSLNEFLKLKSMQQASDIQPVMDLSAEEASDELPTNVPGAPPGTAAPDGEFYLPGERGLRSVDNENGDEKITSWR